MRSIDLTKFFSYLLITAFLLLQWSSSHIHLGHQHSHGDRQHEHALERHAHQVASHHLNAIDVAENNHHSGDNAVLELDYNCTCSVAEQLTKSSLPIFAFYIPDSHRSSAHPIYLPDRIDSYQGYLELQPPGQRAPPQLA